MLLLPVQLWQLIQYFNDCERDQQKSMTETCIEIINKLEGKNKLVFVLEDLHFIDLETYSFLKHFIKIANNNDS